MKKTAGEGVYFVGAQRPQPGTATAHKLIELGLHRPVEEVQSEAERTIEYAARLAEAATKKVPGGMALESISFSLGFDAKGKLGFIAEAGVTASVEVTFKRSGLEKTA